MGYSSLKYNARMFNSVNTLCLFVGYPHSGSTFTCYMLNAHPNAAISDEVNIVPVITRTRGFPYIKNTILSYIFHHVLTQRPEISHPSRTFEQYDIKTGYRRSFTKLKVIGDKHPPETIKCFIKNENIFKEIKEQMKLKLKIIHMIRNPTDNIASWVGDGSVKIALDRYLKYVKAVNHLQKIIPESELINIYLESLIEEPEMNIIKLFDFIGLPIDNSFISAIKQTLMKKPSRPGLKKNWPPGSKEKINEFIYKENILFLKKYVN